MSDDVVPFTPYTGPVNEIDPVELPTLLAASLGPGPAYPPPAVEDLVTPMPPVAP